ncbi:MAG: primosomal protein DnaI [Tuberibacillus sp.]
MESIKSAVRKMAGSIDLDQYYKVLFEKVMMDPRVDAFRQANPNVPDRVFMKSLPKLVEFLEGLDQCAACPGLDQCPSILKGYQPSLSLDKGTIEIVYHPCPLKIKVDREKRQSKLIQSLYVPNEVLQATFKTIAKNVPGRIDALEAAGRFVQNYMQNPDETKGLYIHGPFGVGKTYIMGAILNSLAEQMGVESMMVYTPDFFRELKNSIEDQTINEKLEYIKSVPILVLDDIGAETMSPWIRDDILGSILQRRMMDKLPTLYTSNFDYEELEDHLAYSNKSGTEYVKAKRIMERIRYLTLAVRVNGKNWRA